jgi:hypothetical protein
MAVYFRYTVATAVVFIAAGRIEAQTSGAPQQEADVQADSSRDAERQKILESDRWRAAQRNFDKWVDVQTIYSADEVASLRAELAERVSGMSPEGLESFLKEMEDRLAVLLSPDAKEARQWIAQILTVARDPESHFGGPLPDVLHLSAGEIRAELQRFQQRRSSRRQAQAAIESSRQSQVQAARDQQAARREALSQPRTAATFPEPPFTSPYAPEREPLRPITRRPVYRIGPWGEPIFWDPMNDWHPWRRGW